MESDINNYEIDPITMLSTEMFVDGNSNKNDEEEYGDKEEEEQEVEENNA